MVFAEFLKWLAGKKDRVQVVGSVQGQSHTLSKAFVGSEHSGRDRWEAELKQAGCSLGCSLGCNSPMPMR